MKILKTIEEARAWTASERAAGRRIGLVPTMGFLHAGHLSLVKTALENADSVAASIFVNPTQFGPTEDFAQYPRDEARDIALLEAAGCGAAFLPSAETMYRADASAFVEETALAKDLDGARRPGHFRGVCTVVAKLFNIMQPDIAVFGQKDFQQAAVLRRMVRDLDFPIKMIVAPIVREPDGLAMSSRNKYLSADERGRAIALSRALSAAETRVAAAPAGISADELRAHLEKIITEAGLVVDYVEFVDAETLSPVAEVRRGTALLIAAFCGKTRLIDNRVLANSKADKLDLF